MSCKQTNRSESEAAQARIGQPKAHLWSFANTNGMIPVPGGSFGASNITPAILCRGASPRGLLTSTTYLGVGFEAAQPRRAVRETNKAVKSSIRKPSAICTLWGVQGCTARARESIRGGKE